MTSDVKDEEMVEVSLISRERGGGVVAKLTKDEVAKLSGPRIRGSGQIFNHGLGYLPPSRISGYYLSDNTYHKGAPQLMVGIGFKDEWSHGRAGDYFFKHTFSPQEQEQRKKLGIHPFVEEHILSGSLSDTDVLGGVIDKQYVVQDDSGIIIPITRKTILGVMRNQRKATSGEFGVSPDFRRVKKLAALVGEDAKRITRYEGILKKIARANYLQRYASEKNLEDVIGRFENFPEALVRPERLREGEDSFEENPTMETFDEFLYNLGEMSLPEKFKPRVAKLLGDITQEYGRRIEEEKEGIVKKVEELEGRITSLRTNQSSVARMQAKYPEESRTL